MNKYETIMILTKDNEKLRKDAIEKIENYIKEKGKLESSDDMGLKKLAYEVKKNKEGYYYLINFEMRPDDIYELERIYRITDEILKFIIVKNYSENAGITDFLENLGVVEDIYTRKKCNIYASGAETIDYCLINIDKLKEYSKVFNYKWEL